MKKLIIAEKPSVAKDLARVLGDVPKDGDRYENVKTFEAERCEVNGLKEQYQDQE